MRGLTGVFEGFTLKDKKFIHLIQTNKYLNAIILATRSINLKN